MVFFFFLVLLFLSHSLDHSDAGKFILIEALFGMAPFASGSFAELEIKIRSTDPITVRREMYK